MLSIRTRNLNPGPNFFHSVINLNWRLKRSHSGKLTDVSADPNVGGGDETRGCEIVRLRAIWCRTPQRSGSADHEGLDSLVDLRAHSQSCHRAARPAVESRIRRALSLPAPPSVGGRNDLCLGGLGHNGLARYAIAGCGLPLCLSITRASLTVIHSGCRRAVGRFARLFFSA